MKVSFPIIVKVWAGDESHDFEYITRSLPSLLSSSLPLGVEVIVFDDNSSDRRVTRFLDDLAARDSRVRLERHPVNKGPNLGQEEAYALVRNEYPDAVSYINVDDDVVYHQSWLTAATAALDAARDSGVRGVLTCLNLPFRRAHGKVVLGRQTLLLSHKHPALNWVIPRDLYEEVGDFIDEGVAYDTVYSHYMRLRGLGFLCMTPSLVQNIGLLGAYAVDRRTTSRDFLGPGAGYPRWRRPLNRAAFDAFWMRFKLRQRRENPHGIVWPVRWGCDWVYEARRGEEALAVTLAAESTASFARTSEILSHQARSPFELLGPALRRDGTPDAVVFRWQFAPNLLQAARTRGPVPLETGKILEDLLKDLLPLHSAGIAHGKVRPENLYFDRHTRRWRLAWYGRLNEELPPLPTREEWDRDAVLASAVRAVDKRASLTVRESHAAAYLAARPPERTRTKESALRGDLFGAAATVLFVRLSPRPRDLAALREIRNGWRSGTPECFGTQSARLTSLLRRMLEEDPVERPVDANAALAKLRGL